MLVISVGCTSLSLPHSGGRVLVQMMENTAQPSYFSYLF